MLGLIKRDLDVAHRKLSVKPIIRALDRIKRRKGYAKLKRSLESLIRDFDRLHKNAGLVLEKLKDDLKIARDLASSAKRKLEKKEDKAALTEMYKDMRKIIDYWEGGRYMDMFLAYYSLRKAKVGYIPKEEREELKKIKEKFINMVERYALLRMEKIMEKIERLQKAIAKAEKEE